MFDIIGDIHGHADKLILLLKRLGYSRKNGAYGHPERKALFIGDFIDRGPEIRETLYIVKDMCDCDSAVALMGNHEYNALCFHFESLQGGHLRKHLIKNIVQHYETLRQFQNRQKEYENYLEWFLTLPLCYETDAFCAVHACWELNSIRVLKDSLLNNKLDENLLRNSTTKGLPLNKAIDVALKGIEYPLQDGHSFTDQEGTVRHEIRIKWWEDPEVTPLHGLSMSGNGSLAQKSGSQMITADWHPYQRGVKPVFFGHYWLAGNPALFRENICCLDYSVAKNGVLAAYRYDNESKLKNEKFVFVG